MMIKPEPLSFSLKENVSSLKDLNSSSSSKNLELNLGKEHGEIREQVRKELLSRSKSNEMSQEDIIDLVCNIKDKQTVSAVEFLKARLRKYELLFKCEKCEEWTDKRVNLIELVIDEAFEDAVKKEKKE